MRYYRLQNLVLRPDRFHVGRKIDKIIIHHSASPSTTTVEDIRKWHVEDNGWNDIGYHFVITEDGVIHECRPLAKIGAHTKGNNRYSIGVCVVGNTSVIAPSMTQMAQLTSLIRALRDDFVLEPEDVYGHTEHGETECPGAFLMGWIEQYRSHLG